jgi:hypothetical protein
VACPKHWRTRDWDKAQLYPSLRSAAEASAIAVPLSGPPPK